MQNPASFLITVGIEQRHQVGGGINHRTFGNTGKVNYLGSLVFQEFNGCFFPVLFFVIQDCEIIGKALAEPEVCKGFFRCHIAKPLVSNFMHQGFFHAPVAGDGVFCIKDTGGVFHAQHDGGGLHVCQFFVGKRCDVVGEKFDNLRRRCKIVKAFSAVLRIHPGTDRNVLRTIIKHFCSKTGHTNHRDLC